MSIRIIKTYILAFCFFLQKTIVFIFFARSGPSLPSILQKETVKYFFSYLFFFYRFMRSTKKKNCQVFFILYLSLLFAILVSIIFIFSLSFVINSTKRVILF